MPGQATAEPSVLVLRGVSCCFGAKQILQTVNLRLAAGEAVLVSGESGAGKTVLLNVACGLTRPSAGSVEVCGLNARDSQLWMLARAGARRTFQSPWLPEDICLRHLLQLPLIDGLPGSGARIPTQSEQEGFLQRWAPEMDARRPIGKLSYGQRRFVELLQVFSSRASLYLLDEPLSGLSDEIRGRVAAMVHNAVAGGAGVLIVEHDGAAFRDIVNRRLELKAGVLS